jgi:3'-phosphoadenosine 5'-phosphosulfate sulfotransferase (PAPS reductase)/FAD synthetase
MIRMPTYNIAPPDDAVRNDAIPKPEPESDPVDIWESNRILEVPNGVGEKDRAVLFSGGDDSLALTHLAMSNGWADFVVHLDTNSSIPENLDYVRSICEEYQWPLLIISSPMPLDTFAYRYGFPGASCHRMAFQYFKGRQLGYFYRKKHGDVKLFSGVRKLESDRRMENIEAEVQYEDASKSGNFTGWWVSPLIDKSDEWVQEYRERHGLPRNPVSQKIHRSGDCQCLAFGKRTEELIMIEAEYPEFAKWLLNVERRVQEYRGRVYQLEDEYPDVATQMQEKREETRPYPMKLTVLKEHFRDVYDEIVATPTDEAVLRGRMENTSYIGHGGMSSRELRDLTTSADTSQTTLCETCGDACTTLATSVQRDIEEAASELASESATSSSGTQTTLADIVAQ